MCLTRVFPCRAKYVRSAAEGMVFQAVSSLLAAASGATNGKAHAATKVRQAAALPSITTGLF